MKKEEKQHRRLKRSSSSWGITYASQGELPRLPIPSLEETLTKLPIVLEALQSKEETQKEVDEFFEDAKRLQQLLIDYDKEGSQNKSWGSYVESFWNESYLAPDVSVVLNLNPFFVLEEGPDPKTARSQIHRASSLTYASIKLASQLKHGTMRPDVFKGKTLCMDQFRSLFGSSRVPSVDHKDSVEVYPESTHVVVMCQNQMYYFQALWPDDGKVAVDESDITRILTAIQENSTKVDKIQASKTGLGVLTSLPRKEWAKARGNISRLSTRNEAALRIIDSALFVLVLDDFIPTNANETAANMLHGTYQLSSLENDEQQIGSCCNRWYDKLQIIVCKDGTAGVNFEHSAIDGHTALRFVSDIVAETIVVFAQSITKLIHGIDHIPHVITAPVKQVTNDGDLDIFPKKLVFDYNDSILDRIFFAETALGDEIAASDTVVLEFSNFGKRLIVSNKLSPDAVVQMSILLAYYRLYGKVVCTYEPVLTKNYYHGRTEAQRSATPQAASFCKVWCCTSSSSEEKMKALRTASAEHSRLVKACAQGKGVDRHLFALKCIADRNNLPIPSFFKSSESWKKLNHTILSTSNCGNPALRLFGFGPVVAKGYGVGYIIKDNALSYSVSSNHRQTTRYVNMLKRTLLDIEQLLKPSSTMKVSPHIKMLGGVDDKKTNSNDNDNDTDTTEEQINNEIGTSSNEGYFSTVRTRRNKKGLLSQIGKRISLKHNLKGQE